MTKQGEVRDWLEDKELAHTARYEYKIEHLNPVLDALFCWLEETKRLCEVNQRKQREILSLRARLSAAKEREKKLREAIENALSWTLNCGEYTLTEVIAILRGVLASLYPEEGEAK